MGNDDLRNARDGFGGGSTETFEQYGHEFAVKISETRYAGNCKKRTVTMYESSFEITSDMLAKTTEKEQKDGIFGEWQPIMSRDKQVATTTNEGIKNFLQIKSHKEGATDDVRAAIEATAEIWEEEFETSEEFPQ